jgi:uncharacterized protein
VRAVLDPNVIISAVLSPHGAPARAIRAWLRGEFELLVSPLLLDELRRALAYPKLRTRIEPEEADQIVEWLQSTATMAADPHDPPAMRSPDLGDDYLIALAEAEWAALVSGDHHLLGLAEALPIFSPVDFLDVLERERGS